MDGMLPGVGFSELILLVVIGLLVVGPKDLPLLVRKISRGIGRMRAMSDDFRSSFDEIGRQAEITELRKEMEALRSTVAQPVMVPAPSSQVGEASGVATEAGGEGRTGSAPLEENAQDGSSVPVEPVAPIADASLQTADTAR
jgi:sec-independent protein translocase protein TatB